MKDRYIIGLLFVMNMLLRPIQVLAQDDSQNYIFVEDYKSKREITSYYDGIGRKTLERIGAFAMVNPMKSIYTLTEYDLLGREKKLWQPAVDVNFLDEYKSDISNMSNKTYNDNRAFTEIEYDALGRQIFKSTAGDAWKGKGIRTKYITNDKEHPVRRYKLDSNGIPFNSPVGYYTSCTLTGTRVTDEDNHTIETYKDILGNVVLERRDGNNDTYFVYENGLLRTVIPPLYQDKKESSLLYRYEYDDYGRCKKKILSAGGTKYYWYDKYGRLSFMQDGLLRGKRNFRFYLYDGLGRVAIQGLTRDTIGKSDCSKYVAKVVFGTEGSPVGDTGYSFEDAFSISSPTIEIVNYYDGYDCLDMNAFDDVRTKVQIDKNICTTTLQTAQLVATSEGGQLARVMQYDTDGKCVVTTNTYPDKILVQTTTKYSSTDKPTSVVKSYYKDGSLIHTMNHKLEYDFVTDYLSKEILTMDDEPTETLYENSYNGLGQIESVKMGKEGRIRENYLFDVHGWIKDHEFYNDNENHMPMFKEIIRYADGSKPCYNGNISTIENRRMYDVKVFDYEYDGMDRLVQTKYHDPNNTQKPGSRPEDYSEKFSYNANSALISLHRMGNDQYGSGNAIDELTYYYSGNQLQKVYDRAGNALIEGASDFQSYDDDREHYRYNSCGAMTMDVNKGIMDISYDNIGMPNRIQFKNGSVTEYLYSADGAKLKTIHRTAVDGITTYSYRELSPSETLSTDSTLYVEGCEFGDDFHALKYYYANGYLDWYYHRYTNFNYFVKDYLGNIRMDYNPKGNSRYYLNQMNNYYSYGGDRCDVDKNIIGMNYNIDAQYHKYNGKELDRMHGLRLYDYGARQYDPAIGLFTSVDPLSEKYYHISPYAYCAGNPVKYVDPDGKEPTFREAAIMGNHIYDYVKNHKAKLNLSNWRVSSLNIPGVNLETSNGLKSALYEKVVDGKVAEYAYVTCGSQSFRDWVENAAQLGGMSSEFRESARNAKLISDYLGKNVELTFIGHSQGGAEAALNSLVTSDINVVGRKAITFNAAGLSNNTKLYNGGIKVLFKSEEKIDAYIMLTCPLNIVQNNINVQWMTRGIIPKVNGKRHYIIPKNIGSFINGHSQDNMLKNFKL